MRPANMIFVSVTLCFSLLWFCQTASAQEKPARATPVPAERDGQGPAITIYGQDFAVVREGRSVVLNEGVNEVVLAGVTSRMEPDTLILRDLARPGGLRIIEQRYIGDAWSEANLLRQNEGNVVRFQRVNPATGEVEIIRGRVIRSGGTRSASGRPTSPIIEVDGAIQFTLPGRPTFDAPPPGAALEPVVEWDLWSGRSGRHDVEVSYLTGGMSWRATYNIVAPADGDRFDLVGWVTLDNQSGTDFEAARIRLMAGEVNRVRPEARRQVMMAEAESYGQRAPAVTSRAFDEYHLYELPGTMTLRRGESKQVELTRASGLRAERIYIYDGARAVPLRGYSGRGGSDPGSPSFSGLSTMLEFRNDGESGLGHPLPGGTMKVYRADAGGALEFIGEDRIGHTPEGERVRVHLGSAFDLVGERRQIDRRVDTSRERADESFEIRLRNHRGKEVEVRVVEHVDRWSTWKILEASDPHEKLDARTIEFRVKVPPDGERVVTYRVHYRW